MKLLIHREQPWASRGAVGIGAAEGPLAHHLTQRGQSSRCTAAQHRIDALVRDTYIVGSVLSAVGQQGWTVGGYGLTPKRRRSSCRRRAGRLTRDSELVPAWIDDRFILRL